jgi:hypothetical protein
VLVYSSVYLKTEEVWNDFEIGGFWKAVYPAVNAMNGYDL